MLVEHRHELIKAFIFLGNPWFIYPGSDQGHSYSFSLRKPRFFFVTTSSITSIMETASVCYQTTAAANFNGECPGRKKRSFFRNGRLPKDTFQPTTVIREDELESSKAEPSAYEAEGREGRFLLYWITTTSRSISTSYTTIYSVTNAQCTPKGVNECPGK